MKVTYDIAWRVWYIEAFGQWVVHPPDGFYQRGEFTFLTNVHSQYFKNQLHAWEIAKGRARKYRTLALLYYKNRGEVRTSVNYGEIVNEKIQATERPKHLYP